MDAARGGRTKQPFGSKFLVLDVVALVFGDRVSLGDFFAVTILILVLLVSRSAVRRLLRQPDPDRGGGVLSAGPLCAT